MGFCMHTKATTCANCETPRQLSSPNTVFPSHAPNQIEAKLDKIINLLEKLLKGHKS